MLEQAALTDFIGQGHLERHVRSMRRLYGQRRKTLVDALEKYFGDQIELLGDAAGMHLALRFRGSGMAERAARNKVQIVSTRDYYLGRARRDEFLLGFSTLSEPVMREGVRRLAG
jgi:GntR family transcriptional regulator/MocR family aminotransferase